MSPGADSRGARPLGRIVPGALRRRFLRHVLGFPGSRADAVKARRAP